MDEWEGKSRDEIAKELGLSPADVEHCIAIAGLSRDEREALAKQQTAQQMEDIMAALIAEATGRKPKKQTKTQVSGKSAPVYGPSPIKRHRRTRAEMEVIRLALYQTLQEDHPQTDRQVFYQLSAQGVVPKTEQQYKGTVVRLLTLMRRERIIPFSWIADNTRWMRKPPSHYNIRSMLDSSRRFYRRDLWQEQDSYVEIWVEKDALAGVIYEETREWDVPLMVSRGYSSHSYLYSAAEAIKEQGKPAYIYYFGDHDPSGVDITRFVEKNLREYSDDAEIYFKRVALTLEQIEEYQLPTRPTKKTDSRSKKFEGESVDLDALPARVLRSLVASHIEQHIDRARLERTREIEQLERETLRIILKRIEPELSDFE